VDGFLEDSRCVTLLSEGASDPECPVFIKSLEVLGRLAYCSSVVVRVMTERDMISGILGLFLSRVWLANITFLFMCLFMAISSDDPDNRMALSATPLQCI
jgi:hypothetical protein